MEKISWANHVRNEEVLLRVNEQRNILHGINKRKADWIGHILRRNCLLQRGIEGKIKGGIEVTGRRGRWRRKLLDDLKEKRGNCQLKEEVLDHTTWRARFGRGFGPVVRQTTKWNEFRKLLEPYSRFILKMDSECAVILKFMTVLPVLAKHEHQNLTVYWIRSQTVDRGFLYLGDWFGGLVISCYCKLL